MAIANMIKKETPPVLKFLAVKQKKPITLTPTLKTPNKKNTIFIIKNHILAYFCLQSPRNVIY
jgi:hypothetical protein